MVQLKIITFIKIQTIHFFLKEVQIIYCIRLHFFKPYIFKICNGFSYFIHTYIYIYDLFIYLSDLKFNWF